MTTYSYQSQSSASDDIFRPPSLIELVGGLVVGVAFIVFSFPVELERVGDDTGFAFVGGLGGLTSTSLTRAFGASVGEQTATFQKVWSVILIALAVYLGALALLSLRHLRFDLFALGVLFLGLGVASLHILAWSIILLLLIGGLLLALVGLVFAVLGWIANLIGGILGFLGNVIGDVIGWLISTHLWIPVAVLLGILVLYLAIKYHEELLQGALILLIYAFFIALGIGIYVVALKILEWLAPFLHVLLAFLGRIGQVLLRVLIFLALGFAVFAVGAFLLDQLKGAWEAGSGRRGVMIGAIAIGISLALVMVQNNQYNVIAYFPGSMTGLISTHLQHVNPITDAIIALFVIAVSIIGLLRNVPKLLPGPSLEKFHTSVVITVLVGLGIGIALAAAAAAVAKGQGG